MSSTNKSSQKSTYRYSYLQQPSLEMGEAGSVEQYILALAWQPQLSLGSCPSRSYSASRPLIAAMDALPASAYALNALSLHGLWPEYRGRSSTFGWPEYCNRPEFNYSQCTPIASQNTQSPVEEVGTPCSTLTSSVVEEFNASTSGWRTYALSYAFLPGVAAHEWARHGTCTGWSQRTYFDRADRLVASLELSQGNRLLRRSVASGQCSASGLRAAFEDDVGAPPVLRCASGCVLNEVWLGVQARAGDPMPVFDPDHGVNITSSGADTCETCASLVLYRWGGCPPGPPLPPGAPPPPRQHSVAAASPGTGGAVAARAVAILFAIGLLAMLGLLNLRRARNASIRASVGVKLSDEPDSGPQSPGPAELPMTPAADLKAREPTLAPGSVANSFPMRQGGAVLTEDSPSPLSRSRAANAALTRLIHDDNDEIID